MPINTQVIDQLVALSFKREYVIKCVNANKHNHATTSYYLMLRRAEQTGEIKESDFQYFDDIKLTAQQ